MTWRAGIEFLRGLSYATLAAAPLVADGVLEWTSMDGIQFYPYLFLSQLIILVGILGLRARIEAFDRRIAREVIDDARAREEREM